MLNEMMLNNMRVLHIDMVHAQKNIYIFICIFILKVNVCVTVIKGKRE